MPVARCSWKMDEKRIKKINNNINFNKFRIMKKFSLLVAAVAAMVFASCGNKTAANQGNGDSVSFEQSQIEEKIMVELDSIIDQWHKLGPVDGIFANGKIQLSDDELKVKPNYLLPASIADDMSLLSQKYRAMGMLVVDKKVASLYKMDTDAYTASITKIATDVNDNALQEAANGDMSDGKAFYLAEKEAGRINFFWETSAAGLIETFYILSQNQEKFLQAFDDQTASDMTYHIAVLKLALDDLATYDANIKGLVDILAPLNELNAISVDQLKEQLERMRPQIEKARGEMLK